MEKVINAGIKALRESYGLNQTEMGKIIGVNLSTYHAKETGLREFTITEGRKFKQHFGLDSMESIFFDLAVPNKKQKEENNV